MEDSEKGQVACSIDGCDGHAKHRGWCNKHYIRWRRHGDPLFVKTSEHGGTNDARFWTKVEVTDYCWNWTGATTPCKGGSKKRGLFHVKDTDDKWTTVHATKFSYENSVGQIPEGFTLDWLCKNTMCVNPSHLELLTLTQSKDRTRKEKKETAKIESTSSCWNWTGSTTGEGEVVACELVYETLVGPVPDGLMPDRLCRNTKCVNPDHIEFSLSK